MQFNIRQTSDLDEYKSKTKEEIDNYAGIIRSKFITTVPGQAETYLIKANECREYVNAGYPADTTSYPWVRAEMTATDATAQEAVDTVLANEALWKTIGSSIEQIRLLAKRHVDQSTAIEDVISHRRLAISSFDLIVSNHSL